MKQYMVYFSLIILITWHFKEQKYETTHGILKNKNMKQHMVF